MSTSQSDGITITHDELLQSFGRTAPAGNARVNSVKTPRVSTRTLYCAEDARILGQFRSTVRASMGIIAGDGDAAAPSYSFSDDNTTGMYLDALGNLAFTYAGVPNVTIGLDGVSVFSRITAPGNLILDPVGDIDMAGHSIINTGVLTVANGGTGASMFTTGNFLQGNGTSALIATTPAPVGAVVGTTDTQTLSAKALVDTSTAIVDAADASVRITFDAAGSTNTTTAIVSSQTANRIITMPNATGTAALTSDIRQRRGLIENATLNFDVTTCTPANTLVEFAGMFIDGISDGFSMTSNQHIQYNGGNGATTAWFLVTYTAVVTYTSSSAGYLFVLGLNGIVIFKSEMQGAGIATLTRTLQLQLTPGDILSPAVRCPTTTMDLTVGWYNCNITQILQG